MPTLDKKTKLWTGNVQKKGYPRRIKKGFTTKTTASEWERITWAEMKRPKKILLTFSQASTDYIAWCEKRRKLNTYRQKTFIIRSFLSVLQFDPPLQEITEQMIETYLDHRFENPDEFNNRKVKRKGNGGKAANRDLRELNTLFNWFIDRRYCKENPCTIVEPYKTNPYVPYVPPPEDINKVLLVAKQIEYDLLQCIYHTAGRRGELQRLTWDDVNFETGKVTLWTMKRKGASYESDWLQMNPVLREILETRYQERDPDVPIVFPNQKGEMISKYTLDNIMPRLCKQAGVKQFGFHAIRHHVSSIMMDSKKLSLKDIQKQLRHKRPTTTDIYLQSFTGNENDAPNVLAEAQKKVFHTKIHTKDQKKKGDPK